MTNSPSAGRRKVLVALALAIGNIVLFLAVVRPLAASSRGADARASAAAGALEEAEREDAAARALVAARQQTRQEIEVFYRTIVPDSLATARRLTYTSIPALAEQSRVHYDRRRFEVFPATAEKPLGQLTVRMELQGEYESVRRFIDRIERSSDFVIIDDVVLAERDEAQPLTLTMTLSTYYRSAEHAF